MPHNKTFFLLFKKSHKQINCQRLIDLGIQSPLLFTNPLKNFILFLYLHLSFTTSHATLLVYIDR